MNRYEVRKWAAAFTLTTRPHPYFVTIFFVLVAQLVTLLSMEVGGQPFVIDMDAVAAGQPENAVLFVPENVTTMSSLLLLAGQLLYVIMDYGYTSFCLHACRREKCSYFDLMDGFFVFFRAIILWFVKSTLVFLGAMFFIVPGILLSFIYAQSTRLLMDHPDWSPIMCMRESRRLMQGKLKEYFLLRLNLLIWNIACAFPFLEVFARPCIQFSETVYYLYLTGTDFKVNTAKNSDQKPPWEY